MVIIIPVALLILVAMFILFLRISKSVNRYDERKRR